LEQYAVKTAEEGVEAERAAVEKEKEGICKEVRKHTHMRAPAIHVQHPCNTLI
jgi:hypothetical protein